MSASMGGVLSYLRRLAPDGPAAEDGQLLSRFVQGDGGAFTALVGRYAPLVWGVCQRLLGASPDAEDAFQATFVVLVRKAGSLADGRPLGPWLYRVASRTATKARARSARRRSRESASGLEPAVPDSADVHHRELSAVLDEELGRLPERYRRPVVLCYLEGLTNEEAAQRLACPKGTVLSRLSRARDRLRERLARRGVDPSATLLPAALTPAAPPALVAAVGEAGPLLQSGGTTGFSSTAMILAKGVMFSMFLRKVEIVGLVVLALALAATGSGWLIPQAALPAAQVAQAVDEKPTADDKPKADDKPPKPREKTAAEQEREREAARIVGIEELSRVLGEPIQFRGTDGPDQRLTLGEVLDQLARQNNIAFDYDVPAIENTMKLDELLKTPIAKTIGLPPMKAPLRGVLQTILFRVPMPERLTFLVRKNHIEITTEPVAVHQLGVQPKVEHALDDVMMTPRLLPLVYQTFKKVTLETALDELADATGSNIVLDARVEEKGTTKLTARLINVPIDTATQILAEMCGLALVRIDNVFFVTSPETAKRLVLEKKFGLTGDRPDAAPVTPARKKK